MNFFVYKWKVYLAALNCFVIILLAHISMYNLCSGYAIKLPAGNVFGTISVI